MHAVIRKRQGLPWEKEISQGFSKNSTQLSKVAVIPNFQPMAEDELTLAYGNLAYPKLVREINSPLLTLKRKALHKMLDLMAAPRNIASFVAAECVLALKTAARDDDPEARRIATDALGMIAREDTGRNELIKQSIWNVLIACSADESAAVRRSAFEVINCLAVTIEGLRACFEADIVEVTVKRCTDEHGETDPSVMLAALRALHELSKNDPGAWAAIKCGAIEMCVKVRKLSMGSRYHRSYWSSLCVAAVESSLLSCASLLCCRCLSEEPMKWRSRRRTACLLSQLINQTRIPRWPTMYCRRSSICFIRTNRQLLRQAQLLR